MRYPLRALPLLLIALLAASPGTPPRAAAKAEEADDLLVVHCLLPGQIRRLGLRSTYTSPRRPLRTTALDCRLRGGEYAVGEEIDLRTALSIWLEEARAGDPEAQTTLGELFEKGPGVSPDYAMARVWYERAAARDYGRALINLGNLYEKGLGVAADPDQALRYYRRASGLPDALAPAFAVEAAGDVAPVNAKLAAELDSLRRELAAARQQRRNLETRLQHTADALGAARREVATSAREAREAGYAAGAAEAASAQAALAAREAFIRELRDSLGSRDQRILELEASVSALEADRLDTQQLRAQIAALENDRAAQAARLQRRREELREMQGEQSALRASLEASVAELDRAERESATRLAAVQRLLEEIERLQAYRSRAREAAAVPTPPEVDLAGPSIAVIEPQLSRTRGLVKVSLPAGAQRGREVIGRVTAPAGLLTLKVNGLPATPNARGVFRHRLTAGERSVHVVAIDEQGKRADLSFEWSAGKSEPDVDSDPPLDLGEYHALLIGNSRYRHLPSLSTPQRDVARLAAVLQQRYGFRVSVLRDATRYEILSALNRLRETLSSDDNLLVYYAGHGELDDRNMRGHWLPVDAEPTNTANWLSNVAITDILNVIRARHVMLMVDSCYSGTMTRSSIARLRTGMTDQERETWLRLLAEKRSRVVLTSGGLAPVLDGGGGNHSVFARALLAVLESSAELLTGRALYEAVAARVAHAASRLEFEQIPAYAPIARAGHEAGDFVLLPGSSG